MGLIISAGCSKRTKRRIDERKGGLMTITVHGPDQGKFGIRIKCDGIYDYVPRVDGLISALEFAYSNHSGIVETVNAVVIGDEPATQNGSEVVPTETGATLALAKRRRCSFPAIRHCCGQRCRRNPGSLGCRCFGERVRDEVHRPSHNAAPQRPGLCPPASGTLAASD